MFNRSAVAGHHIIIYVGFHPTLFKFKHYVLIIR